MIPLSGVRDMRATRACAVLSLVLGVGCRDDIVLESRNGWAAVVELTPSGSVEWATGLVPLSEGLDAPSGTRRVVMVWDDAALRGVNAARDVSVLADSPLREPRFGESALGSPLLVQGIDVEYFEHRLLTASWPEWSLPDRCCEGREGAQMKKACEVGDVRVADARCPSQRGSREVTEACAVDRSCPRGVDMPVAQMAAGTHLHVVDAKRRLVWDEGVGLDMMIRTDFDPSLSEPVFFADIGCGFRGSSLLCRQSGITEDHGEGWSSVTACDVDFCGVHEERFVKSVRGERIVLATAPDGVSISSYVGDSLARCLLATDGRLFCSGQNRGNWMGTAEPGPETHMVEVAGRWRTFAFTHTLVVASTIDGDIVSWRRTHSDQALAFYRDRGDPTIDAPHRFTGPWREVASTQSINCALDLAGRVHCWGANGPGRCLGALATDKPALLAASSGGGWRQLRPIGDRVCALDDIDTVVCWGHDLARPAALCFLE